MGHPKARKSAKYERPLKPYDRTRMAVESKLMRQYGLKRKHEIWRAEAVLRDFRRRARELLAKPNEQARKNLFDKINSIGLSVNSIEDILSLKIDDILSRRLQTELVRRGIASTHGQARQLIAHRHIIVDGRVMNKPGYILRSGEEDKIVLSAKISPNIISASAKGETK